VADGLWHRVVFNRDKHAGHLSVDDEASRMKKSLAMHTDPSSSGSWVWIGGSKSSLSSEMPRSVPENFVGCVAAVKVEDRRLPLSEAEPGNESDQHCRR
jgi:hypothetical protein